MLILIDSKNRADIIVCRLFGFGFTKFYCDFRIIPKFSFWI